MVDLSFTILDNSLFDYVIVLSILVGSAITGKVTAVIVESWIKYRAEKTKTKLDDVVVETIDKPIMWFIILIGARIALSFLSLSQDVLSIVTNLISIAFILVIAWTLSRFTSSLIRTYVHQLAAKTATNLDDQLIKIINRVLRIGIFAIAGTIVLEKFGYDITSVVAGLGIGGLAIALAAQETLKDAFGGFSIFTSKPFKVGDAIIVDGLSGEIEEIGIRYTKIRTWDKRAITMPNSKLASSTVENITSEPKKRDSFVIGLTYSTSAKRIKEAKELLEKIFREDKDVENDTWRITFEEFASCSLNLRVIYFITNLDKKFEVLHRVHLKIKEEFDKERFDFAFPTQTLHLVKD